MAYFKNGLSMATLKNMPGSSDVLLQQYLRFIVSGLCGAARANFSQLNEMSLRLRIHALY